MMETRISSRLHAASEDLAFRDDLTGLFNRRLLTHLFDHWWAELTAEEDRLALLMLDLDGFKEVNDTRGHLAGDAVLRRTAEVLRRTFRGDDILVRFGGDEFVVLLPGAGQAEADRLGERARQALCESVLGSSDEGAAEIPPVSFSLGVATFPEDGATGEEVLDHADRRLYSEKRERRPVAIAGRALWGRWLLLGSLVLGAAGMILVTREFFSPAPQLPAAPPLSTDPRLAPTGPSPRELALLEEIVRLKQELAARETREAADRPPARTAPATEDLRTRILELEGQLDQERAEAALPAPTPLPAFPTPRPTVPSEIGSTPPFDAPTPPAPPVVATEIPPRLLRHEMAIYPERARQFRREATVEVRVTVDANGRVIRTQILGSPLGLGFEEAARRVALSAVYTPGTRDGKPAVMDTVLAVDFRLAPTR